MTSQDQAIAMVSRSRATEADTSSVPDQIPARMVNEFAYCPRLFYLEYVQREWAHSAETLDGRFVHRRVDQERGRVPEAEALDVLAGLKARSILIGSDAIGAIARIDVIEAEDGVVTPIDYKRGAVPDIPLNAYEPERVQVCLQGLLLRENGYTCDEGFIYFAKSQRRIVVEFTVELVDRTLELLELARTTAASGIMPPALEHSPKCPRCSLVGICLPDETNMLRLAGAESDDVKKHRRKSDTEELRRLIPARDDRMAVYVQGYGYYVGLKGERLEIRKKGKAVDEVRLIDVAHVNLFGNVQMSAQALRELISRDVPIVHLSYGGWLNAITTPLPHKNIELRQQQFLIGRDEAACLRLAQSFVIGKIRNQRTLLRRNGRDVPKTVLRRMDSCRKQVDSAAGLEQLLGMEGTAARYYFGNFARMLKTGDDDDTAFDFTARNRRPPRDPVNAMLSFLYAMLTKDLLATIVGVGLDPYLGFYHQPRYGRPALALDLMEEFRPLIADSIVVRMINKREIGADDFVVRAGAAALTENGRKAVLRAYERRMNALITHPLFGYSISYRRVVEVQVRLLARVLQGEIERYPAFVTR